MLGYNRMTGYNVARYNAEGFELQAADTLPLIEPDPAVIKEFTKALLDLMVIEDTSLTKEQNKSVTETLRMDAWLRVKREDSSKWED